jgi:peptidoglycan hydrolase-like protein with peptidoglycan-binding domain
LNRQLSIGSTGEDVKTLQTFLASYDHVYPEGLITGYFGALTANAVASFQAINGLPSVGRVGPLTLQKLKELTGW